MLPIYETASFILSLTLFHPLITSFVDLVYFWHNKVVLLLSTLSTSVKTLKENCRKRKSESCEVASKECAMLPPSPPSLPLVPPPLRLASPSVYCHWCVCMSVFLCVCVHAQGMETPKVGPMTSDPLLLPRLPVAETIKKKQTALHTHKKRGEKKDEEQRARRKRERERAGKEGKPSCKQHNANESLAEAQSCSERVPRTNPLPPPELLHPSLTN